MDQKQVSVTYERDGIKFQYIPLLSSNTEGHLSSTTLRANKGVSSYMLEIRSDKIGELLPIAKDDIDIFNRIVIAFLMNDKTYSGIIEIKEESEIIVTVDINVFGKIQKMRLVLVHENVGELILMKRKIEYLTEKVEMYENTKMYYINMNIFKIYDIKDGTSEDLDWKKIYVDGYKPTKYRDEILYSKTKGFFKEISNYDLREFLNSSPLYENYMKPIKENQNNSGWDELQCIIHCCKFSIIRLELYLYIITRMGFELTEISMKFSDHHVSDIVGLNIRPSKNKCKYIIAKVNSVEYLPNKFYTHVNSVILLNQDGRDLLLYSIEKIII